MLSIRMLKLCGESVYKPLNLIFKFPLKTGQFPSDAALDIRPMFVDFSKAFDKVWYQGLLYKLKQNGISGSLLETLTDFLKDRNQRVVLNGQNSSWANTKVGNPQGSTVGPLLFLIYINDLPDNLSTNVKLFLDDTSLISVVHDVTTSS